MALPRSVLIAGVVIVLVIVVVAVIVIAFPAGPDTVTQPCPSGQCNSNTSTIHFSVTVNLAGCQPWFQAAVPQINSFSAQDTFSGPTAAFGHGLDLLGTNMNIWSDYIITYPSGTTFKWTSTQYAVNSGNGACSLPVNIIGYFTGPTGTYQVQVVGFAQATGCWPGSCTTQSASAGPKPFNL